MSTALNEAPNLLTGFPRSPNEQMGGYVLLARIIDKCRAVIAGTNGEYNYNCPLDRRFFEQFQVDSDQLKAQVATGLNDEDLLAWVKANSLDCSQEEVLAWSYKERWRRPSEDMMHYFEIMRLELAPDNYNIETWFQLLDADENRF